MATLKEIKMRLKSVQSIRKITKTMKMVSAAKFNKAERELRPARSYGIGTKSFFEKAEMASDLEKPNHLLIALTSDRGLCGATHSSISKAIRNKINESPVGRNTVIVAVGDKSRSILQRTHAKNIMMHFTECGKQAPVFADAAMVATEIMDSGYEFDHGEIGYNVFRSVIAYTTTFMPLFPLEAVSQAKKIDLYDSIDQEVLRSYNEFAFASLLFFGMKEGAASEQSARMSAMENATKNAGEMIDKLQLTYNRTRQAVITTELIDIVTGASALKG